MIFQTSMIMFHVNLPGCSHSSPQLEPNFLEIDSSLKQFTTGRPFEDNQVNSDASYVGNPAPHQHLMKKSQWKIDGSFSGIPSLFHIDYLDVLHDQLKRKNQLRVPQST